MLKYIFIFFIFCTQSLAQVNWSFETEKNKSPLLGLDQKGSTNVIIKKNNGKLKLMMPSISVDNSSKTKVTLEDLSDQKKSKKQTKNENKIVDQNSKKIDAMDKEIAEGKDESSKSNLTKNKNISKADIVDTSFKKRALNFKNLMRETLSAQDAVFEAVKNIISEQKVKKVVEGDYLPYVDTEI